MQFMYVLTLTDYYRNDSNWTEETNQRLGEHFNYLKSLYEQGVMKHVGRTNLPSAHEHLHGYAIFETTDEVSAAHIMNSDPAVIHGIMTAQVFPYIIVFN